MIEKLHGRWLRGQSMLEYAVLISAVTLAMIVVADYVRQGFSAHAKMVGDELSGQ